jgi:DNA-binding GntR family transcriptional regulator
MAKTHRSSRSGARVRPTQSTVTRGKKRRPRSSAPAEVPPSLADRAYVAIRDDILRGQLRPGMPVSRRRVARELQMSVLPVTDALRRLREDGLLETRARAGTRVRIPTKADVQELYELREALETQAARLFATRATDVERRALARLATEVDRLFDKLASSGDNPPFRFRVHQHHVQLHMTIAEYARSGLLRQMIERNHVLILNWLFDVVARRTPLPPDFHTQLANALLSGDADKAGAAMRAHVRYGLAEISSHVSETDAAEWRERRRKRPKTPAGKA